MYVNNEWGKLKKVILGSPMKFSNYNKSDKQYEIEDRVLKTIKQHMENKHIKVIQPKYIKQLDINQSLWTRDSSIVIEDKFILLPLQNNNIEKRKLEYKTVMIYKTNIIANNVKLEGGDIIQLNHIIFVGINERTNTAGYRWIKNLFPNKHIIKINHKALHLDCCFCILPNNVILYSKKYIDNLPCFCNKHFHCINIDKIMKGETNLSTNFIFLDEHTILIDNRFKQIRILLNLFGYKTIVVNIQNMWKYGGSIRCLTQPLMRETYPKG